MVISLVAPVYCHIILFVFVCFSIFGACTLRNWVGICWFGGDRVLVLDSFLIMFDGNGDPGISLPSFVLGSLMA